MKTQNKPYRHINYIKLRAIKVKRVENERANKKSHEKIFSPVSKLLLRLFSRVSIFVAKDWCVRSEKKMMFCVRECKTDFPNVSLITST